MGRRFPILRTENNDHHQIQNPSKSFHPELSLSLLLIGMAACISITTTLCGVRFRKRPKPQSPINSSIHNNNNNNPSQENIELTNSPDPPPQTITIETLPIPTSNAFPPEEKDMLKENNQLQQSQEEYIFKELPLPPAKQLTSSEPFSNLSSSNNLIITKSSSTRNLKEAITMKMPRSISVAKSIIKRDINREKKGGAIMKQEDSLWRKTIILGEKCKVPDNHEEEDVVVRDGKGHRVTTYHPRSSSLLPYSIESFVDQSSIPDGDQDK